MGILGTQDRRQFAVIGHHVNLAARLQGQALSGEITLDLKEGDLLPETYFYSRDDTRDGLLMRMKEAMEKTLDWAAGEIEGFSRN